MNSRQAGCRSRGKLFSSPHKSLRYAIAAALGGASLHAGTAFAQLDEIVVTATFRATNIQDTPIAITAVNGAMLESRGQTNIVDVANQAPNVTMTPAGQGSGSAMITFIRGIGQTDFNYALEPGVGMYVDDVYYPNLTGSMVQLLDISRVEIARGPQGTLAGRNSIGGSVKIYSVEPTHNANNGNAELVVGSYDKIAIKGAADLTFIPDKLSARISGISSSRNGYVHRVDYKCTHPNWPGPTFENGRLDNCKLGDLGGESFTGGRFALLWTPSDKVSVKVLGDLINQDNESAALVLTRVTDARHLPSATPGTGQFNPARGAAGMYEGTFLDVDGNMATTADRVYLNSQFVTHGQYRGDPVISDPHITYATFLDPMPAQPTRPYSPQNSDPGVEFDDQGLSVQVDWDITDDLSLKWISAYRKYEDVWAYDTDGSPFFSQGGTQGLKHEHVTNELRLNGSGLKKRLDWTVGAYYVDQKEAQLIGQIDLYYAQLNFIHGPDPTPSDSQAIFAHTVWHFGDKLDLQVGYRRTEDSKFYQWFRHNPDGTNIPPCLAPPPPGGANSLLNPPNCAINGFSGLSNTFDSSRDDYRVALDYKITDKVLLYGSFATGYKGGGLNPRPFFAVQTATFGEEEVETTEIGVKTTLADGRIRLNGALFHNDQTGIQLNQAACETLIPQAGQTPTPITVGGVTYSTFIGPPCAKPQNVGDANTDGIELEIEIAATDRLSIDFMASSIDFQYTRLDPTVALASVVPGGRGQMTLDMKTPYTPELTWSAGVQYEFPLPNGGSITARLDAAYQDEVYTQAVNYTQAQPLNDRKTSWIDNYTLSHMRLTWRSATGGWETALDVSNLTDELYYQNIVDGVYTTVGYQTAQLGPPRMWTMAFRKSFGL